MNQVPLNKNELPLVREILTKYKQGYISGLIPGSNITLTPSGCRNKIISSTGDGGSGDMLRSTYDPTNKNADAFSMENMIEGATKKILTSAERTKLNNLSGTNTGDQDLTPYLTSATATSTYQPILVSGTTIKTINGNSLLGSGDITISAAAALSDITAATAANTINNGDKTQTWTWNSISNQSGLKLSSTASGTIPNKTQKLFESVLTGAMINSSNASYAGYFDNQQTIGGAYGIYARGYVAAQLEGIVNINGSLNVNNLVIWNNSGVTYLHPSSNQAIVIGGGGNTIQNSLNGCATAFSICTKIPGSKYVYGMGMVSQWGSYLSESTTNTLIERDGGNMLLSANAGLAGGYNSFTPNYQIALAGATNNVGIVTGKQIGRAHV